MGMKSLLDFGGEIYGTYLTESLHSNFTLDLQITVEKINAENEYEQHKRKTNILLRLQILCP